jgi:acyl-coenzyme A thioesterase PaaI-like protein
MKEKLEQLAGEAFMVFNDLRSKGLKGVDPIKLTERISNPVVRKRILDTVMSLNIPFNRWVGLRIDEIDEDRVVVLSPPTRLRQNHVGGTHAACLVLLGEYAAGMCVANHYGIEEHRLIIGSLSIDYHKQGLGLLRAEARAPSEWPSLVDGEAWIEMTTHITNEKGEDVATCRTKWQLKDWSQVGKKKAAAASSGNGNDSLGEDGEGDDV